MSLNEFGRTRWLDSILLFLIVLFGLFGCSDDTQSPSSANDLRMTVDKEKDAKLLGVVGRQQGQVASIGSDGYGLDMLSSGSTGQAKTAPTSFSESEEDIRATSGGDLVRISESAPQHDHGQVPPSPNAVSDGDAADEYPVDNMGSDAHQEDVSSPLLPELRVSDTGGVISWEVANAGTVSEDTGQVTYKSVNITLTGPDDLRIEEQFNRWEEAELDEALPDGSYSWEAYAIPEINEETRWRMFEIREVADQETQSILIEELRRSGELPTERQIEAGKRHGQFTVKNGYIVRNDIVEN